MEAKACEEAAKTLEEDGKATREATNVHLYPLLQEKLEAGGGSVNVS
jgi:hypothetical protein